LVNGDRGLLITEAHFTRLQSSLDALGGDGSLGRKKFWQVGLNALNLVAAERIVYFHDGLL
jgi:hypothetical protein